MMSLGDIEHILNGLKKVRGIVENHYGISHGIIAVDDSLTGLIVGAYTYDIDNLSNEDFYNALYDELISQRWSVGENLCFKKKISPDLKKYKDQTHDFMAMFEILFDCIRFYMSAIEYSKSKKGYTPIDADYITEHLPMIVEEQLSAWDFNDYLTETKKTK